MISVFLDLVQIIIFEHWHRFQVILSYLKIETMKEAMTRVHSPLRSCIPNMVWKIIQGQGLIIGQTSCMIIHWTVFLKFVINMDKLLSW